jgi:hypothetical protein
MSVRTLDRDTGSLPPIAAPADPGDGGGGSRWVQLFRARNDIDAHLLMGRLSAAGIEASTLKDRSSPGEWMYGGSNPWAPVMVMVRRLQLEDARLVLAEIAYANPPATRDVERPGRWTPVLWWTLALTLGIALTGVALARTPQALTDHCDLPILCTEHHTTTP